MSLSRLLAIICIYALASAGWIFLGGVTMLRSGASDARLEASIVQLWGQPVIQDAPSVVVADDTDPKPVLPESSVIHVDLDLEHRRKGLLWYSTYRAAFDATYAIRNEADTARRLKFALPLPDPDGTYDGFSVLVDGHPSQHIVDPATGVSEILNLPAQGQALVTVRYHLRGLSTWRYRPGAHLGRVRSLDLTIRCNATNIDFPEGSLSPAQRHDEQDSTVCTWSANELITRKDIAITMPDRLNPGPLVSRITYFAPVCLGFFFLVVGAITVVCRIPIHPMHYLFIAGGFFAFHLLLAYLVDVVNVHLAFPLASATTLTLVTTYLRSALGGSFPTMAALAAQAFFLVLFSYSFFLDGTTGLTVAIGSVVTLAFLMRLTARVDWNQVFTTRREGGLHAT